MGRFPLKSAVDMEYMRESGQVVARTLRALSEAAVPGMTTAALDAIAHDLILAEGAKPNFLGYGGFPASVCISVNEEIVHGIPGGRVLEEGDIVSFDGGAFVIRDGRPWHADSALTVVLEGGDPDVRRRRLELSEITRRSMWAGIGAAATARRVGDIGEAVELGVIEASREFDWEPQIVEGYTGHGIGNALHEDPEVHNYRTRLRGPKLRSGAVICIEPMLTDGDATTAVLDDEWTVVTLAGGDSAHWEHTVAIGDKGISVLTALDAGEEGLAQFGITPLHSFV